MLHLCYQWSRTELFSAVKTVDHTESLFASLCERIDIDTARIPPSNSSKLYFRPVLDADTMMKKRMLQVTYRMSVQKVTE